MIDWVDGHDGAIATQLHCLSHERSIHSCSRCAKGQATLAFSLRGLVISTCIIAEAGWPYGMVNIVVIIADCDTWF